MFRQSLFWGLVAAAALVSACTGEIGGLAGDGVFDSDPELVATLSARNGWQSIEASQPATGRFEFTVMARAEVANIDAMVAVGAGELADASDALIKVRFADDGSIDARDGMAYKSNERFRYQPGFWYEIGITADVSTGTYDVDVRRRGGKRTRLVTQAAFDPEAGGGDQLTNWGAWSSQWAKLDIAEPVWIASGSCAPTTCESLAVGCGEMSDGCGGALSCGGCASGKTCTSGVCVNVSPPPAPPPSCEPATCMSLGAECGTWGDGCGGTLSCGGCANGQACSSGLCVDVTPPPPPSCEPATCMSLGAECGNWGDGCNGTLSCGGCASGQVCSGGSCIDVPEPPPVCQPDTCMSLGAECGAWSDGCGGSVSCGGCASGQACSGGSCIDVAPPPPPVCEPDTCQTLGTECGSWSDGCGSTIICGGCGAGEACLSGQCSATTGKQFSASRTSCMAPCAVHFNAQERESLAWAQVRDSQFLWDFDDGAATAEGFIAAHVFDTPGTYSVGLTVDGTRWIDKTITVSAPKRTICVSPTANFGGCPSSDGSDHFTSLGSALNQDQTNVHVLLHRGEDFGSFGGFANDGPTLYGAYGSGPKPTMKMTTEETMGSNVVWQDLDIYSTRVLNLSDWSVLRRIDASGTITGSPDYWLIAYYVDNFFVLDCNATVSDGGNGAAIYVYQAQRSALKGSSIYRQAGGTGHTVRANGADRLLIQDNTFNENGGPDSLTIRGDNDGSSPNTAGNAYWTLVQGNTFENSWPVIKPQFPAANELVQYVIWEQNRHNNGAVLRIETAHDVMARNNVFMGSGEAVSLVDNSNYYDPKRIWAIDNTCGSGSCADMVLP